MTLPPTTTSLSLSYDIFFCYFSDFGKIHKKCNTENKYEMEIMKATIKFSSNLSLSSLLVIFISVKKLYHRFPHYFFENLFLLFDFKMMRCWRVCNLFIPPFLMSEFPFLKLQNHHFLSWFIVLKLRFNLYVHHNVDMKVITCQHSFY